MNWPLVSRRAYDLLIDERDRLRGQNDGLLDDLKRMKRVELGMREAPRKDKPKADEVIVPEEVRSLYGGADGFESRVVIDELDRQAIAMYRKGTPWSEIREAISRQLPQEVSA